LLKGEDRLQSVGKYFPYGEDRYSPNPANPTNDQEKFATYTRDSVSGLDYALNRYYSAGMGRFMTPDPYRGSAQPTLPQTMNRYSYVQDDPANLIDPTGLDACGDFPIAGTDLTIDDEVNADTGQGHYIDLVWHEAGVLSQAGGDVTAWTEGFEYIAQAIWDRSLILSGQVSVTGGNGVVYAGATAQWLGYGAYGSTLNDVLIAAAHGTKVLNGQGQLVDNASGLQADLDQDQGNIYAWSPGRLPLENDTGAGEIWVTQQCYSVIAALEFANGAASGTNYNPSGAFITSWNSSPPINNPNYAAGVEQFFGNFGRTNIFGFTSFANGNFAPKPRSLPQPRKPFRPRRLP
jgi:RHS repeat-associated protein